MNNAAPADKLKLTPEESESLNPQAFSAQLAEFELNLARRRKWASVFMMLGAKYKGEEAREAAQQALILV